MVYYSQGTGQPLAFKDFAPNGIWRSATGREDIDGEWLDKKEFVIDIGYCTEEKMAEYIRERVPFIVPVDPNRGWVRREIDANMKKLVSKRSLCLFQPEIHGVSVRQMHRFGGTRITGGIYLHLYYSHVGHKEKDGEYSDFSALVSRKKNSSSECLRKYRTNERIGYFFEAGKQHDDSVRMCAWGHREAAGLVFVQFLALCYYEHIREEIHKFRPGPGKPDGNPAHDTEENLSAEAKLGEWLDRTPVYRQLQWFGTDGEQDGGETAALKRLCLEKIGMEQPGGDE